MIRWARSANMERKLSRLVSIVSFACPNTLPVMVISSSVKAKIGFDFCWLIAISELKSGIFARSYACKSVPLRVSSISFLSLTQFIPANAGTSFLLIASLIISIHFWNDVAGFSLRGRYRCWMIPINCGLFFTGYV